MKPEELFKKLKKFYPVYIAVTLILITILVFVIIRVYAYIFSALR